MKYCEYCKVHVRTDTHQCPLCKGLIREEGDGSEEVSYPPYVPLNRKKHIITRIFAFIVICLSCAMVLTNIYTFEQGNGIVWSVIGIAGLLYLWFLVQFTCMTKINLGVKLLLHALLIPVLLIIINVFYTPGQYAVSWALSYATPFIIMAFVLAITITVAVSPMRWREYTLYQFSIALIGFVPLILMLIVTRFLQDMPLWPSIVAAVYSLLTLISMFLFMDKRTKTELRRRFHLKQ